MSLPIFQPTVELDLDDVRIASPCKMEWAAMTGGDRVRHCAACQKNVFNLSGMKRKDALDLLRATEGKICARIYRRKDGTILTADCPVGVALLARKAKRAVLGACIATLGAVGALLALLASSTTTERVIPHGVRDAVTTKVHQLVDAKDKLIVPEPPDHAVAGGLAYDPRMEMGDVALPAPARSEPQPHVYVE
jgi:hypothetical protein